MPADRKTVVVMTTSDHNRVRDVMVSIMDKSCKKIASRPLSLRTIVTADEAARLHSELQIQAQSPTRL